MDDKEKAGVVKDNFFFKFYLKCWKVELQEWRDREQDINLFTDLPLIYSVDW